MTTIKRTPSEQKKLNENMRRPQVLEFALHQALHATPASASVVKAFLATAPPEVFVLLDGLTPQGADPNDGNNMEQKYDDPIVAGVVGWLLNNGSH